MKLFCGGISTETNTFSPMPTGWADYDIIRPVDLVSQSATEQKWDTKAITMLREMTEARGWEFVFSLSADAPPAGKTVRAVYEDLRAELLHDLQAALPVDGVLLLLHGAMVADDYDDCEGDLIARVREIVGLDTKIGVSLDLHCHLTQRMVDQTDAIVILKEYPHIDGMERNRELFAVIADAMDGKVKPTMGLFDCRMVNMYPTTVEPMRGFVDAMMAAEGQEGVLSLSLGHGFPYGDVADCGTRMLAITDNNPEQAAHLAEAWGRRFFSIRHDVAMKSLPMQEALDRALAVPRGDKPVVVADQADNPGGGAPSDSTFVLRELLHRGITDAGIALFWDPIAVQVATSAGEGAELDIRLGGKMGPMSGDPLDLRVKVIGIIKNMYQEFPQTDTSVRAPCGDSVALWCEGIDIIVGSRRVQALGTDLFTNFGIDPTKKRLLVVKSTQHFYAAYAPITNAVIYMAAPGALNPIYTEIPYTKVDRNKFPWVDDPFAG